MTPYSNALYARLIGDTANFPVRFTYGGKTYNGFCPCGFAEESRTTCETDEKRTDTVTLRGPENLTVRIETAFWKAYGACEWTLYFENNGDTDTALLSDLYCCDLTIPGEAPILRGILGDRENKYRAYDRDLTKESVFFESTSGRATHINFPYFNLECGAADTDLTGGALIAIGWAGTWSANFTAEENGTHLLARSVIDLSLNLHPGEHIRTALMLVLPYAQRNEDAAMNLWRSWFTNCNMPKANAQGDPVKPFSTVFLAWDTGRPNSDGSISEGYDTWRPSMEKMLSLGIVPDFRWIDAGWYTDSRGNTVPTDWWGTVGSWEPDPVKWPGDTLLENTEFTRAHGMKTLLWFEPERVTDPEGLAENFGYNTDWAIYVPGERTITNNIGVPECREWTTERICRVLRKNKIEMYREDNNCNPGPLWKYLDEKDGRTGITECRMIEGHYKMWDDILETTKSYGGCAFCDSCASGGGRNDLESLRRGIPLLRSDYDRTTTSLRLSMTSSFCRWIPVCGANSKEKADELAPTGTVDVYTWRASYMPVLNTESQFVLDPGQDFDMFRFGLREWKDISRFLMKDFYVLTPWHSEEEKDSFTAFLYHDPKAEEGVVLVFRMENCEEDTFTLTLPIAGEGLVLTDADTGETLPYTAGMPLTLAEKRTAKLLYVKKA